MTMCRSDANFTGPHMEKSNNLTGGLQNENTWKSNSDW